MFKPHFGICICHNEKRLIVVKKGFCKQGNDEQKGKAKSTGNRSGDKKMSGRPRLLYRKIPEGERPKGTFFSDRVSRNTKEISSENTDKRRGKNNKAKKRKPIRHISKKRQKQEVAYQVLRKVYLATHPACEAKISKECAGLSNQVHHMAGRIGELLNDDTKFLATCGPCHMWIENNRIAAIELGFSELRTNK